MDGVAFLGVFEPQLICSKCLAVALDRDDALVAHELDRHIASGATKATHAPCLNCEPTGPVVPELSVPGRD